MKKYSPIIVIAIIVIASIIIAILLSIARETSAPTPNRTSTPVQSATPTPSTPNKSELLTLVNAERGKAGVTPLRLDKRLVQSAQRKADDMAKYEYIEHISPHDGRHGYEYANDTGIPCVYVSENLRENDDSFNTSGAVVLGWLSSAPHKQAMLDPKYTLTGFGINGRYIVEHFCQE